MSQYTAPVPPPPLPPVVKAAVLVFSVFMTLVLVVFIGIMAVDFTAEMAGHPLWWLTKPDPMVDTPPLMEQDIEEELKEPFELITPKHQTQLSGPDVVVIYTVRTKSAVVPNLRINDTPHSWETQYGDNTWFARLQLPAGKHHLQVEEAEAEFFVAVPDSTLSSPDTWRRYQPHIETNEVDRCAKCHEMSERSGFLTPGIGAWMGASSCFACHDEEQHATDHLRYALRVTTRNLRCIRCHTVH